MPTNRELFDRRVTLQLDDQAYDGLHVQFDVDKTVKKALNTAKITAYNLPSSYEQYVGSRDLRIRLIAGYAGDAGLLFEGNPTKGGVSAKNNGGDFVVEFEASDGLRTYQSSTVSTSIDDLTTLGDTLDRVVNEAGLTKGKIVVPEEKRLTQGVVLHGSTRKVLDRLGSAYNADWSIQNGKLNFLPREETANEGSLFSPKLKNILEIGRKDDGRLRLKTLLDRSAPGDRIKVEDTDYDGIYKIETAKYKGSSGHTDNFYSTFEARRTRG